MKPPILIVEDDAHIRLGIEDALIAEGYATASTGDGLAVDRLVKERKPQLVILDIMLPGRNGFDVCRELRAGGCRTPILMLTAKGQEIDKVVGLELGADDYVTKPFGLRELLARVHALLRRAQAAPRPKSPAEINFGRVCIDPATLRGHRDGKPVELTARELNVLMLLYANRGKVISRERLLTEVWGMDFPGTTRTVDQVIVKLRQKVEAKPSSPRYLTTVHGIGYRLEE